MSILVLTSDTLIGTPATGNIEYNGQFFGTDSNASRAQMQRLALSTAVATTSGTSIDFTGLPAWVKKITVMFYNISTNGANLPIIQLGAGSITSTGYISTATNLQNASAVGVTNSTAGFVILQNNAAENTYGSISITTMGSNIWVASGQFSTTGANANGIFFNTAGGVTLSGTLDRVRLTTSTGVDTFDSGSINILYEG